MDQERKYPVCKLNTTISEKNYLTMTHKMEWCQVVLSCLRIMGEKPTISRIVNRNTARSPFLLIFQFPALTPVLISIDEKHVCPQFTIGTVFDHNRNHN